MFVPAAKKNTCVHVLIRICHTVSTQSSFAFFAELQAILLVSCLFQGPSETNRSQSCSNYACDSTAVKALLDINGLAGHDVSTIIERSSSGRVCALDLRYSGIHTIPPQAGSLSALEEFTLFNNQLTSLPAEVGQLTQLKSFYLNKNLLQSLPDEIGQLTALEHLWLGTNRIESLPRNLGNLDNLKILNLNDNRLTEIPPAIGNLKNLEELELQGNRLESLPDNLTMLSTLTYLDIDGNRLCHLPAATAKWLDSHAINDKWKLTQTCP